MFSIGQLSEKTGCKVTTIRFYEKRGLMPAPERTEGNQRRYTLAQLQRLSFICHARELGFNLQQTQELLTLAQAGSGSSHEAEGIVERQIENISRRIQQLNSLKQELEQMLSHCDHKTEHRCQVIEVLSDHSLCESHQHPQADMSSASRGSN